MLRDQATELRNLVRRAGRAPVAPHPAPRLVALAGGKGGVGVTTLAVRLSAALAELGTRLVLVDANLYQADVAPMCGLAERGGIGDVLAARRDVHEVMQAGPQGIQILPGSWAPTQLASYSEAAQQRFIQQLKSLGRHAEIVLLDIGAAPNELMQRLWREADLLVLVTTPDNVSVMDTYAVIKTMGKSDAEMHVIVNRARGAPEAEDVYRRLAISCERFLALSLGMLGSTPEIPRSPDAGHTASAWEADACEAWGQATAAIAQSIVQRCLQRRAATA